MTTSGTRHDIGDYRDSGFAAPLIAMPADDAALTLARLEAVDVDLPHPWYYKSYLLFTWMDRLVRRPAILDAVEQLTGPDIMVMSADIWTKPARDGRHISFHQDAGYWNLDPLDIVTAWVALTPATSANGCMQFLPGTHRLGRVVHDERMGADNMLSHGQTASIDTATWPVYDNELEPGAMSLHHALLVHGSGPNTTDSPRTGICIRYLPGRIRWTSGPPVSAMPVRGRHEGNVVLEKPPTSDLSPEAVRQHTRLLAPHAAQRYVTF
ncbi:MAG: phytanoyl-CoA dioxygenase family protein [bacterium]|nr:phytanoyl-CoA dioxygenase family protein [bacterium]MDE0416353.1 phytanoyl-CoA dioxygenase family protein [bacterium]